MTKDEQIEFLREQVKLYRFDYLTGLKQRRDFEHDLRKKLKVDSFWLCYYDVNNLHKTNREQGFAEGDKLIRQVANDIQYQDIAHLAYRTSGDEFYAICCSEPTHEVENATMVKAFTEFDTMDDLLDKLDKLMIEAKAKNKTRRATDV